MAKTKLQELVLSFNEKKTISNEIVVMVDNMDQVRQVLEIMNEIGMCANYSAWMNSIDGHRKRILDHILINIQMKNVSYRAKKYEETVGEKQLVINARDYTVKRKKKKLLI